MALTEYATSLKDIGRLQESEQMFYRALAIAKQCLGPRHEQVSFYIFSFSFCSIGPVAKHDTNTDCIIQLSKNDGI